MFALFFGAFTPAVFVMLGSFHRGRVPADEAVTFAAEGIVYAVLMTIFSGVVRRRRDGADLVEAQRRAIRERRLPDDVDTDVWLTRMSRRLAGARGRRWGTVGYAAFLAALSVLCFVLGHQWWWFVFAAYFVVGGMLLGLAAWRTTRATELLVDELVLRSGGGEAPSSGPTRHPAAP
jgi:hypothetical protein